jgi:hypothetical protein
MILGWTVVDGSKEVNSMYEMFIPYLLATISYYELVFLNP